MPGPTRFWPAEAGAPPTPMVIVSPRRSRPPFTIELPVDPALLAAGDHNGSTFYQHERFLEAVRGEGPVEVGLDDGWKAAMMGMAAQASAQRGNAVTGPFAPRRAV